MIPRMTTVGTLKNYRYSLNRSNNTMAKAMETVLTGRLFNSYAEDPALATRCFQIRRSFWRASSQLEVNESLRHKYDVAWSALDNASTDLYSRADDASVASIIRSLSGPTGPGRPALGQSLCAKAKDIAQIMNGRYGENYVFAGADTLNAPFTWEPKENSAYIANPDATNPDHARAFQYEIDPAKAQNGELYTNDPANALQVPQKNPNYDEEFTKNATVADVDDPRYGEFLTPDGKGTTNDKIANLVPKENEKYDETSSFKYLKADGTGTNEVSEAAQALYYRGVPVDSDAPADVKKMEYFLKQERKDIDVGLGHKEQNGEVVTSTVFDSSLQGIYFMDGYGTKSVELKNDDGTTTTVENIPKNIISIVNEMGQILQRCSKDDGNWASPEDEDRFNACLLYTSDAADDANGV